MFLEFFGAFPTWGFQSFPFNGYAFRATGVSARLDQGCSWRESLVGWFRVPLKGRRAGVGFQQSENLLEQLLLTAISRSAISHSFGSRTTR